MTHMDDLGKEYINSLAWENHPLDWRLDREESPEEADEMERLKAEQRRREEQEQQRTEEREREDPVPALKQALVTNFDFSA